jgi:hypothetical protein
VQSGGAVAEKVTLCAIEEEGVVDGMICNGYDKAGFAELYCMSESKPRYPASDSVQPSLRIPFAYPI